MHSNYPELFENFGETPIQLLHLLLGTKTRQIWNVFTRCHFYHNLTHANLYRVTNGNLDTEMKIKRHI